MKVEKVETPSAYQLPSDPRVSSPPFSVIKPRQNTVPLKLLLPKKESDDDCERPLMIDERKSKKSDKVGQYQRGPIKLRLSGNIKQSLK